MGAQILVIGDLYMPADGFRAAFDAAGLLGAAEFRTVPAGSPTRPLPGLAEYQGTPELVAGWLDGHRVLCVHAAPVTRDVLQAHPSVRLVACGRGGPVNIDLAAAAELGVTVTTTPGKNALSVADLTEVFLVVLLRRLLPAALSLRSGAAAGQREIDSTFAGAQWTAAEPRGRVLGLIGFGAIGRLVADRALALGMTVLASDPHVDVAAADPRVRAVPLDELLAASDVVSVHARPTPENRHLLGRRAFAAMRPGAYVINTSRQSLVDEEALLAALESGHLAGAALDVFEPAERWADLARRDDVLLTPHIGGATDGTRDRGARMLAEDVRRFLADEPVVYAAVS